MLLAYRQFARAIEAKVRGTEPGTTKAAPGLTNAEFEVHENDECYATACGPRDAALREAFHYAQQCDGTVQIFEITRTKIEAKVRGTT